MPHAHGVSSNLTLMVKLPVLNRFLMRSGKPAMQGTELGDWGFMPTNPSELRKELDKRSLSMVGAFVPVFLKDRSKHAAGAEAAVKTAKLMADAGYPDAFIVLADENGSVKERTSECRKSDSINGTHQG